jgi:hypothetical protein
MKSIITARLYLLQHQDRHHELTVTTAADLAAQVQALTGSRQAAQLARAAWTAERADLTAAGVRLVAVGQVVRQTWSELPQLARQVARVAQGGQQRPDPVTGPAVPAAAPPGVAMTEDVPGQAVPGQGDTLAIHGSSGR